MDGSTGGAEKPSRAVMKQLKRSELPDSSPAAKNQGEEGEEEEEEKKPSEGRRAKRERRQSSGSGGGGGSSATVCLVCSIQLNSSAQAQIHYRGKTHQRRLRRLAKAVNAGALSQSQVHPLLGSLALPGRPLQPQTHAHLEHFLPLRINSSPPLSLFPNFNTMDPVQKAVINHTFGVTPPRKKPIISCNICHLRFNSTTQAEAHYKGHKHARKLKALESQRSRQKGARGPHRAANKERGGRAAPGAEPPAADSHLKDPTGPSTSSQPDNGPPLCSSAPATAWQPSPSGSPQPSPHDPPDPQPTEPPALPPLSDGRPEEKGAPPAAGTAPLCRPQGSSAGGSKHKQMLNGRRGSHSQCRAKMTSSPRTAGRVKQRLGCKGRAVVGVSSQPFHCEMCQVSVNSETQLKQHMNSRRHKERLAGKPVKVKFTPYNKLQPSAILATKLALQKQLSKALPAGFLTSPLNPAALCTMASGPLALRLPPGPTAIIQGPLINPTLFRPAPGPLRATHAPIIFSPY
ncbi:zinc finger protein 385C-like isoform X2 [Nelusetta ayraudi]|uniref:zinc finger protein 385C-like isoform X2 n=1 Tax=Nelusetta ayraudi TaxID=303726 RepID=UPI003F6F9823